MQKEYITIEKKESLEKELNELVTLKRKEIADALEYAKSLGDLSENAEYHQAREDQAHLEDRIGEIEYILKNAEITKPHHSGKVEIGSTIIIKKKGDKNEKTFYIVGTEESDIANGKLSNESPLGLALLGKDKNEKAVFTNPKGEEVEYTVVDIK